MIKHVIFDCGKVLVHYDEVYIASFFTDNAEDAELLGKVAMARKYWDRFDAGILEDEDYKKEVKAELPLRLHDNLDRLYADWIGHCPQIDGMSELVDDVKQHCDIYLLSNFNKNLRKELHKIPVLEKFDGLVISGEIKLAKPHAEIYQYVLETYHLDANDCIFIDDAPRNIEGAEAVGIHGYLFDGDVAKLRAYLMQIGVIS